jgi:hypothetical protein
MKIMDYKCIKAIDNGKYKTTLGRIYELHPYRKGIILDYGEYRVKITEDEFKDNFVRVKEFKDRMKEERRQK